MNNRRWYQLIITVILIIIIIAVGREMLDLKGRINGWKTKYDGCNDTRQSLQIELNDIKSEIWKSENKPTL